MNSNIKVYSRIKPEDSVNHLFNYEISSSCNHNDLLISPPPGVGYVNNNFEKYKFKFDKVFPYNVGQMEVFEVIGKPIVNTIKRGHNATIMAYGQTGSGKTYTMLGPSWRQDFLGIIPRCLEMILSGSLDFEVILTYIEIYNETAFDLLSNKPTRVVVCVDESGEIVLKNVQRIRISNIKEAKELLLIGEQHRNISSNSYNDTSSRSHCVLTISYSSKSVERNIRSVLNLVDLAGSERIRNVPNGKIGKGINETCHINKSLHFLEVVVNTLGSNSRRTHIPYRNSVLTSILRHTIGGDNISAVITTLSVHKSNLKETLSSCRFAARVSRVTNRVFGYDVMKNKRLNTRQQLKVLKTEVERLQTFIQREAPCNGSEELTDEEKVKCNEAVNNFISKNDKDSNIEITDPRLVKECFRIIRERLLSVQSHSVASEENNTLVSKKGLLEYPTQDESSNFERLLDKENETRLRKFDSFTSSYSKEDKKTKCLLVESDSKANQPVINFSQFRKNQNTILNESFKPLRYTSGDSLSKIVLIKDKKIKNPDDPKVTTYSKYISQFHDRKHGEFKSNVSSVFTSEFDLKSKVNATPRSQLLKTGYKKNSIENCKPPIDPKFEIDVKKIAQQMGNRWANLSQWDFNLFKCYFNSCNKKSLTSENASTAGNAFTRKEKNKSRDEHCSCCNNANFAYDSRVSSLKIDDNVIGSSGKSNSQSTQTGTGDTNFIISEKYTASNRESSTSKTVKYSIESKEKTIPLTGVEEIDEEIIKFYKMRELSKPNINCVKFRFVI